MTRITPMYPTNHHELGTFRKDRREPSRFFLACAIAVLTMSLIGASALCQTRIAEINRQHAANARV